MAPTSLRTQLEAPVRTTATQDQEDPARQATVMPSDPKNAFALPPASAAAARASMKAARSAPVPAPVPAAEAEDGWTVVASSRPTPIVRAPVQWKNNPKPTRRGLRGPRRKAAKAAAVPKAAPAPVVVIAPPPASSGVATFPDLPVYAAPSGPQPSLPVSFIVLEKERVAKAKAKVDKALGGWLMDWADEMFEDDEEEEGSVSDAGITDTDTTTFQTEIEAAVAEKTIASHSSSTTTNYTSTSTSTSIVGPKTTVSSQSIPNARLHPEMFICSHLHPRMFLCADEEAEF